MSKVQPEVLGQAVESIAGRDTGAIYLVIGFQGRYLLLSNGRERKVQNPKKKNIRHVRRRSQAFGAFAKKLYRGEIITDEDVRQHLNALRPDASGRRTRRGGKGISCPNKM